MLDKIRKRQRWLTAFFIFAIGIVFVFFLGLGGSQPGAGPGSGADEVVVELDNTQIQLSDYLRVRSNQEERIKASLGAQYDPSSLASFLDAQALNSVVNNVVMSQSALDLGLVVSTDEVKDFLRRDPNLRNADGRFDQETFDANVKWNYGSQSNFLDSMQRDLLQQKLFELLSGQAHIGDAEALSAANYRSEQVRIAFVAIDPKNLPDSQQPGEHETEQYLDQNREDLKAAYDAENDRFSTSEQVRMRHILIKSDESETEDKRARAEQVLERLAAGEQFEDLAREFSGDLSSKDEGGKLGLIGRDDIAPNLEAVAFDLEPGTPSEIIDGIEGLHIVWVDEKIPASKLGFDEAGLTLAAEGAAQQTADRLAKQLSDAIAEGQSLEAAASNIGFRLEETSRFARRRDGFIPGLGRPSLEIAATAFSLSLEAPSSERIFEVGDQQVLIQLLERRQPDPEVLEAAVEQARLALSRQRQNALLQTWIDTRREEFESQQRLQIHSALIADR